MVFDVVGGSLHELLVHRRDVHLPYLGFDAAVLLSFVPLDEVPDAQLQQFHVEGLRDVVVGSGPQFFQTVRVGGAGRQHDERNGGGVAVVFEGFAQRVAVHSGHHGVAEYGVGPALCHTFKGFGAVVGHAHAELRRQFFGHEGEELLGVVDHEQVVPWAFCRRWRGGVLRLGSNVGHIARHARHVAHGKVEDEDRAAAGVIGNGDRTAVHLDELLHEAQADAASFGIVFGCARSLIEAFEDVRLVGIGNAFPRVAHLHFEPVFLRRARFLVRNEAQGHVDASAFGRELVGVREQVVHHFAQFVVVERHHQRFDGAIEGERHRLFHQLIERLTDDADELYDVSRDQCQAAIVFVQLPEVEHLVHQSQQSAAVAEHQLQFSLLGFVLLLANQSRERRQYQREWRAQFVADIGKEIELHAVESSCLFGLAPHLFKHQPVVCPPDKHPADVITQQHDEQHVAEKRPCREVEGRTYANVQPAYLAALRAVGVDHLHFERVTACR